MYQFNYQKAGSQDDAVSALSSAEDGKFLAGGMTLIPTLKMRLAQPSNLVDLSGIDGLVGIEDGGDSITIGAMTRHVEVASSDVVGIKIPAPAASCRQYRRSAGAQSRDLWWLQLPTTIRPPIIRAAVLALNATVITNKREIAADDFFDGMFATNLEEDELVTAIRFPVPEKAGYAKFPNPASRYALVGVMVAQTGGETPRVRHRRRSGRCVPRWRDRIRPFRQLECRCGQGRENVR